MSILYTEKKIQLLADQRKLIEEFILKEQSLFNEYLQVNTK